MKSRLCQITDWAEPARAANYRASELAKECGVSTRELERFFLAQELHISHVGVIARRRHIAATAVGLGIHL